MNEVADSQVENQIKTKRSNKTLIAILVVAVLPVVAAYIAFFTGWGVPENTVNAGHLLKKPIRLKALFTADGSELLDKIENDKKWRLIIPIGESCSKACQQNLYITRQVHVRLSEKGARLERYAINLGGDKGAAFLASIAEEYPFLKSVDANHLRWYQWLDSAQSGLSNLNEHFYMLVDQEGNAMMYYTTEQDGNALLKDIKRALKYSIDYQ